MAIVLNSNKLKIKKPDGQYTSVISCSSNLLEDFEQEIINKATFTAGYGIKIQNNVIQVSFENGDNVAY